MIPITIKPNATVGDALNLMKEYKIGGIPVVDSQHKLVGIVTNRDLRFEQDMDRPIREVMTRRTLLPPVRKRILKRPLIFCRNIKLKSFRWWMITTDLSD